MQQLWIFFSFIGWAAELFRSFTDSCPVTMRLAAFVSLAGGKAGRVTFLFLNSPDNIDFLNSDDPDAMFDCNPFDFSECHVLSPFFGLLIYTASPKDALSPHAGLNVSMQYGAESLIAVGRIDLYKAPGIKSHASNLLRVGGQESYGGNQIACTAGAEHQAGFTIDHQLARSPLIGDDYRQAGGLRLKYHIPEGVGGTREHEQIGRSIAPMKFLSSQIAGKQYRIP